VPRRGIPTGVLAALGLALAMGGYIAWYQWSGRGERVVDAVPRYRPGWNAQLMRRHLGKRLPPRSRNRPRLPRRPSPRLRHRA